MFELRIVGATPHELMSRLNDAANALLIGAPDTRPAEDIFPKGDTVGAEAQPGPNPSASEPPKKRGRSKATAPVTIDATANPPLEAADFLDPEPATTVAAEPAKTYTAEDCREAVKQCLENAEARLRAANPKQAEADLMRDKVAWTKPLLAEFNISKVSDLKPAQYEDFIAAAQPYIDGTKGQ